MDSVTLIHRARDAGLRLEVAGNALKITGPKEAEPFVRLLANYKAQVLEALTNSGLRELRKIAPESLQGDLQQSVEEEARRDREHGDAPYASALAELCAKCPACVPEDRWHRAIADATTFTTNWGAEAQAFGWTAGDLFGLHPVPAHPTPTFQRLSRYDETGLIWLLRGRAVVALTETNAAIQGTTAVLTYRKINKPALGPVGDSLEGAM
jgi:hypothetical protein